MRTATLSASHNIRDAHFISEDGESSVDARLEGLN